MIPLRDGLKLYAVIDGEGRLVSAGDPLSCALLLPLIGGEARGAVADEFSSERVREAFARWLDM